MATAGPAIQTIADEGPWPLGVQSEGALGMVPSGAVQGLVDGVWSDDGTPELRGGASYKSTVFGAAPLRWVWDGTLAGGRRTVFSDTNADLGVLAANDTTPVTVMSASVNV